MTPILDRIRSQGGEVIRSGWRVTLRRGRLKADALAWLAANRQALMLEIWPEYDDFEERAAIMEYDGGLTRDEAEAAAFKAVSPC